MARVTVWLGAGLLTTGVSAAVLAGAGAANADTADGSPDPASQATSADAGAESTTTTSPDHRPSETVGTPAGKKTEAGRRPGSRRGDAAQHRSTRTAHRDERSATAPAADPADPSPTATLGRHAVKTPTTPDLPSVNEADGADAHVVHVDVPPTTAVTPQTAVTALRDQLAAIRRDVDQRLTSLVPEHRSAATATIPTPTGPTADAADPPAPVQPPGKIPIIGDIIGPFQPDYPPVVRAVGSAVFNLIGALVQTVDGPPTVPPELRDKIQVSSSTLVVSPRNELDADWYFPTTGQPERLIYLQHGILASGPMYSYTAAYLAERTNSVVVVTTITSNPFADNGMWLGGDNMHNAVAQLFLDDNRQALNTSLSEATLKAGRQELTVPKDFVLVGHSLGGGFAPGVAGHYAEGLVARRADNQDGEDTANHLAGVVMLDAVPFYPIMPNAMGRLQQLEDDTGDPNDYVPVYEIGAPLNYLNAFSSVNDELTIARPGKFNGVVVNGGVHMDGMLGGNPLIQAAAYLVAGIPQPQNPPGVQLMMAGWINDMFAEKIDPVTGRCLADCEGQYAEPGGTITIPTDEGDLTAVVIDSGDLPGTARAGTDYFQPRDVASTGLPLWWRPVSLPRSA
jgi:hypothetical protein